MNNDEKYGINCLVSDFELMSNPNVWLHVKNELIYGMTKKLIPDMLDDGQYHVMKFDIAKRTDFQRHATEYALIVHHSVAEQRRIIMPIMQEIEYNGYKYDRVCLHCGNKLTYDKRGSCAACGAPNGGYK